MHKNIVFKASLIAIYFLLENNASAEGIVNLKPYVGVSTTYDDNLFRFSSKQQALATFGSTATSDSVAQVQAGVDVNLRLSRQLVSFTSNINDSQYSRFNQLNNVSKSLGLTWSWRLGNDLSGEIGTSQNKSMSGFNEISDKSPNFRTASRQYISANWQFQPSWTMRLNVENASSENSATKSYNLDRESNVVDTGVQYSNPSGTQVSLDYRNTNSNYPNRTGFELFVFGSESTQKEWIIGASWLPTPKTRINAHLSQVNLSYKNTQRHGFSGLSESLSLEHAITAKTSINLEAYKEVTANDELITTYIESTGFSISPTYKLSEKLKFNASFNIGERNYLGNSGIFLGIPEDRLDKFKNANFSISYLPTDKSLIQLSYQGERRSSNVIERGYDFNTLNMSARYNF